ncbi:MAG: hypothetical protein ABI718_04445 [Acidobacteriota bacterium]
MTESRDDRPPEPGDDFFLEIESHFAFRRGTPFVLSAKDWALMKSWQDDGVPLPVVLEAIDQCFDKRQETSRRRTISSLSYCRHAVAELWDERRDLHIGGSETVPEESSAERLEALALDLEQSQPGSATLHARLGKAALAVRELTKGRSVPRMEQELIDIERELLQDLLVLLPPTEGEQLQNEVGRILSGFVNLDETTIQKTREANLYRLLRKRLGIPRLSLFG